MKERNRISRLVVLGASCLVLVFAVAAGAAGDAKQKAGGIPTSIGNPTEGVSSSQRSTSNDERGSSLPLYKPPLRGAPEGRIAGGSRSSGDELPSLHFLAPDHVGLTTKEQPVLYWFVSEVKKYPLEFSIVEVSTHDPIVEVRLKPPRQAGIQTFRLADHGGRLKMGILYRCFVKMIPDPARPSRDLVALGDIRRVEASEALEASLKHAPKAQQAIVYAGEGLWYDAMTAVSEAINASPKEMLFRKQRVSLLMQGGLKEVAEFDGRGLR